MKNIYELGVDINSNWEFHDGDLKLISYEQNMGQAVINRLKCYLGAMNIFYNNYGSQITHYLGEINNKRTWEYIRIEIETSVLNDPRITNVECTINRLTHDICEAHLELLFYDGSTGEANLVITGDGTIDLE
jgi:hypothetical protein|nr:MAG TPA: baseplate wedge protein [Caudoviricetes sp.]